MITRQTDRLTLREFRTSDLAFVHSLHLRPEVDEFNTIGIPGTIEETEAHVNRWLLESQTSHRSRFVFYLEGGEQQFVGLLGVNLKQAKYRSAEIWYKLLPEFWRKGLATEAVKDILSFCFVDLHLHRVEAGCATQNTASWKVLEKCGFTREALTRQMLPVRGQWLDNYGYAILENDYFNPLKN